MKQLLGIAAIALLLAVFVPALSAKAAPRSVLIPTTVKVGSTVLPEGHYTVLWDGSGPDVQVTLHQGKTTVTAPAKIVDRKNGSVAVNTAHQGDSNVLTEIAFKDLTLVFAASAQ
jgi:hypothetical protein